MAGGRYDNLLAHFDAPMPAIGFSVSVSAVAKLMLKQGRIMPVEAPEVLVFGEEGYEMKALLFASELAEKGKTCENSVFASLEEAEKYAALRGIRKIALVGEGVSYQDVPFHSGSRNEAEDGRKTV